MRLVLVLCAVSAAPALADFKRLYAERATASSFLESNWNKYQENYHPTYVLDDDPKTAWVEGAEGDGVGEALTIPLSALKSARALKLVLTPGYQKSRGLFAANGTPTALSVVVKDLAGTQTGTAELTLKPAWGQQTFEVPVKGGLASVTLTVKAVRAGAKYRDTCLSDVQVFVDSDTPYDTRVEEAKRKAMTRWKTERLAVAKEFAALPRRYPFPATRYQSKQLLQSTLVSRRWQSLKVAAEGKTSETKAVGFVELEELLTSGRLPAPFDGEDTTLLETLLSVREKRGGTWYSVASRAKTRLPDGLDEAFPSLARPFLDRSDVTLFESKATRAEVVLKAVEDPSEDNGFSMFSEGQSDLLLLEGSAKEPRLVAFLFGALSEVRVRTYTSRWVLLRWDDGGRLDRVVLFSRDAEGEKSPAYTVEADVWRLAPNGELERRTLRSIDTRYSEVMERAPDDGHWVEAVRYVPVTK
jgi:hypothetical protein